MALKKREKILAAITGSLLLVLLLNFLIPRGGSSLGELRARQEKLQGELEEKRSAAWRQPGAVRQLARWQKAGGAKLPEKNLSLYRRYVRAMADRMAVWEKQSLPSDLEQAQSLYRAWLREAVERAGFRGVKFDPSEPQSRRGAYTMLRISIQCQGSLEQLVRFLHDFYSAGYLHKISLLTVAPDNNDKGAMQLAISVQALSLPEAEYKNKLNPEPSGRLAAAELASYRDPIVKRNLFAAYSPPVAKREAPRAEPPKPPAFDHSGHTVVTAIVEVDGRRQVWLLVRTTGQRFELFEGDTFAIGAVEGKVARIGPQDVEIEMGGRRRLVAFGQSLAGGRELPQQGQP
jgi:Tfp pilus assembly protein PilO